MLRDKALLSELARLGVPWRVANGRAIKNAVTRPAAPIKVFPPSLPSWDIGLSCKWRYHI
jgi:hypothetical protein